MQGKQLSRRAFIRLIGLASAAAVVAACAPQDTRPATVAPAQAAAAAPTKPAVPPTATPAPTADPKAGWPKEFNMGYFGGDDPAETMKGNEPFRVLLEKELGIKTNLFTGTSYTAVIEAMRNKKVEAMEVGPFSYILARQEAGAEAIATGISTSKKPPVYDATLVPYYYSCIFTKKGSGINKLADLKGRSLNFVGPASTSGHLMPKTFLIKNGINPDKDTTSVFAGSHPTSVLSVWNDKADAGATHLGNLQNLAASNQIKLCFFPDGQFNKARTAEDVQKLFETCAKGDIAILGVTDPIPNTPFAIRGDLPEALKGIVKKLLLSLKDNQDYITAKSKWYVDPAPELGLKHLDNFYDPLRDIAKMLDLDLKKMA